MATDDNKTSTTLDEPSAARATPSTVPSRVDRSAGSTIGVVEETAAGRTAIADGVVAKIAGIAAREVPGVFALGGGGARALGAIRDAINATDLTQGVRVEVGETQAAADITIVVDYPTPIHEVAANVRAAVAGAIIRLVGLEVVEVNVAVNDVHLPGEDNDGQESRVS